MMDRNRKGGGGRGNVGGGTLGGREGECGWRDERRVTLAQINGVNF